MKTRNNKIRSLSLALAAIVSAFSGPLFGQTYLGIQPADGASGNYGGGVFGRFNQFEVTQPIRLTALNCWESGGTNDIDKDVYFCKVGEPPVYLAYATVTAASSSGHFLIWGSEGNPSQLGTALIDPVVLQPGIYAVFTYIDHPYKQWVGVTNYINGPGIRFICSGGVSSALYDIESDTFLYRQLEPSDTFLFGPTFQYELLPVLPPLQLGIARLADRIQLSWPTAYSNAVLQASVELNLSPAWADVAGSPNVGLTNCVLNLPMTNAASFFRLRLPGN